MIKSIKVLLPIFPTENIVYFKGTISIVEHQRGQEIIVYVTEYSFSQIQDSTDDVFTLYGCCSEFPVKNDKKYIKSKNSLILQKDKDGFRIKELLLLGKSSSTNETECIIMLYDHKKFKSSETVSDTADHFSKLQDYLKKDVAPASCYEPAVKGPQWLSASMFAQHLINYYNAINWLLCTLKREKRVSIKLGNLILAILTDIALGYIIISQFQDKKGFTIKLMSVLEKMVNMLYSLLKWLMGSPAGLKLNNAFNKMLGKYFSYHIQLWWLFLDVTGAKLDIILQVYHYLGLIALLRLFVGRKYNPLRGGIDSCEYTNQELFVGTVAFTILLLLLPTTTMYYIVFTLFRLLSLGVQYSLAKLIYIVQTLPLYVTTLWLLRSPKVAGNILLELENTEEGAPLVLRVKLFSKSLQELVTDSKPPVEAPKLIVWSSVFSNVIRGNQIV
ncbi:n-acetylglucosaminyl transferase component (Gpi1) domain-containing protein [Phthorimaea operculella]|nr:n-acetylglucosaminyl transferase component (Gpi1) domain-containing protein [Phthorimaea operculella]